MSNYEKMMTKAFEDLLDCGIYYDLTAEERYLYLTLLHDALKNAEEAPLGNIIITTTIRIDEYADFLGIDRDSFISAVANIALKALLIYKIKDDGEELEVEVGRTHSFEGVL